MLLFHAVTVQESEKLGKVITSDIALIRLKRLFVSFTKSPPFNITRQTTTELKPLTDLTFERE